MLLTQIQLDQIKREVRYDPETGYFFYLSDRLLPRRHTEEMATVQKPKVAHRAGDRADKIYGKEFVGVYVMGKAMNASHMALFFITGHWPQVVEFRDGDWKNLKKDNLQPKTKSEQTTEAAQARYAEHERALPPNIYGTSGGKFIAKKGDNKTRECKTIKEAQRLLEEERWL